MRDVFISLLEELSPKTIVWKTMSKQYTKEELIQEIRQQTEAGNQYISDFLRIVRDFISRTARSENEGKNKKVGGRI